MSESPRFKLDTKSDSITPLNQSAEIQITRNSVKEILSVISATLEDDDVSFEDKIKQIDGWIDELPLEGFDELNYLLSQYGITHTHRFGEEQSVNAEVYGKLTEIAANKGLVIAQGAWEQARKMLKVFAEHLVTMDLGNSNPGDLAIESRRNFIRTLGIAGAGLVAAGLIPNTSSGNETREDDLHSNELAESRVEVFAKREGFGKMFSPEQITNRHEILAAVEQFYSLPIGDYGLSPNDNYTAASAAEGRVAFRKNLDGTDTKSIMERWFAAHLIASLDPALSHRQINGIKANIVANNINVNLPNHNFKHVGIADLNYALQFLSTRTARSVVVRELYNTMQLQENNKFGFSKLSESTHTWANQIERTTRRSHVTEALMFAENTYDIAMSCLTLAPEIWFDALDTDEQANRVDHISSHGIASPGLIAMLEAWETMGTTYIGDAPYLTQINVEKTEYASSAKEMEDVAIYLEQYTGFPYTQQTKSDKNRLMNIHQQPGSLRGNPRQNGSGGAVFGQFMPINLKLFMEKWQATKDKLSKTYSIELPDFHPGSPFFMTLLKYLYVCGEWRAVESDYIDGELQTVRRGIKGGYTVAHPGSMRRGVRSWNPHTDEVSECIVADGDYRAFHQNTGIFNPTRTLHL